MHLVRIVLALGVAVALTAGCNSGGSTASAGPAPNLDCQRLLPQALRDRYLDGAPVKALGTDHDPGTMACSAGGLQAMYSCRESNAGIQRSLARMSATPGTEPLPGVGRRALISNGMVATVWDSDTDCLLSFTSGGGRLPELAVAATEAVSPDAIR